MSGFRFGLQKVLDLREQTEQDRAAALADAERRARDARHRLEEIREIRDQEMGKLMAAHGQGRSVGHLRNLSAVIQQLNERVERAETAVRDATREVDDSRSELVQAMTERRVMDQLKDRKAEAWDRAQQGSERKRMDELALRMFQQGLAGNGGAG